MIRLRLSALLLACTAFLTAPASAAAPFAGTPAPGFARATLGAFEVTALSDGTLGLPMRSLLIGPKRTIDTGLTAAGLPEPVVTSFNSYLVNTGTKLVLVDAGAGSTFGPTLGKLTDNLKAAGYAPEQIDEIYITHFHPDHVGGLATDAGERVFPNAVVRADAREAAYWMSAANAAKALAAIRPFFAAAQKSLKPYVDANAFKPFTGATALVPGVRAIPTLGHTPGHTSYVVESGTHRLVVVGDIVHAAAVQFPDPEIAIAFDSTPSDAIKAREAIFAEAARNGEWIAAAHVPFPGIGNVVRAGRGYRWNALNYAPKATL